MANPLADAIRRIVGFDPTQSKLSRANQRGAIVGMTGIGYMEADKAAAQGVTRPKDSKPKKKEEDGIVDLSDPYIKLPAADTGGNRVDATDPTKAIYRPGQGEHDADKVINPTTTTTLRDSEDLLTGVGMLTSAAQGGGTLNALTGITDCTTGKEIDLRLDGMFVPPPGWENAETPPGDGPADHWELGISWFAPGFPAGYYANNPLTAATAAKNATFPEYSVFISETFDPAFPHAGGTRRYIYVWEKPLDPTHDQVSFYAQDEACSPAPGDPVCPTENPASPQYWPEDNKMSLIRTPEGFLQGSSFEPPADRIAEYEGGNRTTLNFCFSGGTRQGRLEATNEGGYMIYEKLAGVGQGIYKIFGPDNRVKGYSDVAGSEAYRILPGEPIP